MYLIDSIVYIMWKRLQDLYMSPQVQSYLNCVPAQDAMKEKRIYQPGCLRKVFTKLNKLVNAF